MACHCCGGSSLSKISPGNNLWQLFVHEVCCILLKIDIFFLHIVSMITLAEMERTWTARGMPAANRIPSPLPLAHPRTQWTAIRSGTTHCFPSKLPLTHPFTHLFLIPPSSAGASPSSETRLQAACGKLWPAIFCTRREPIELLELYGSRHVCVRENLRSDRSILVKSGINTTDGLSSYAQYEHRKHTHTGAHSGTHTGALTDA